MPVLKNPRHERFALLLAEGLSAYAAYEQAGYQPHDGNCIRLRGNERVKARLSELQQAAQQKTEISIQSLLEELEHARQRADSLGQLSASVKAITSKAAISGLLVERHEVGKPGDFDDLNSVPDIISRLKDLLGPKAAELFCLCFGVDENGAETLKPGSSASYRRKLARFKAQQAQRVIEHRPDEQPKLSPSEIEAKKPRQERQKLLGGNGRAR
jgi:hypothetical protein